MTAEERAEILALADEVAKRLRRDMFAAAALQGLLSNLESMSGTNDPRRAVNAVVEIADLLARRLDEVQF